jgi:hypothetical protein
MAWVNDLIQPWALALACFRLRPSHFKIPPISDPVLKQWHALEPFTWDYGLFQTLHWHWHATGPLTWGYLQFRSWALAMACFRALTWGYGLFQNLSLSKGMLQTPYMRLWPVSEPEVKQCQASDPLPEVMACFRPWALALASPMTSSTAPTWKRDNYEPQKKNRKKVKVGCHCN